MNENEDNENDDAENVAEPADRPLGYWLRVVDALLTREFASALAAEGASRREWMLLNVVSGDVRGPLPAHRHGKGLRRLEERGWIARRDDEWELTDEGRAARDRLGAIVAGIRERVTSAIGPDGYRALVGSLESIARELGGDDADDLPRGRFGRRGFGFPGRGFRPGFGFGPGFAPGFGPAFAPGHGFGPRHGGCDDHGRHGHGHGEGEHRGHRGRGGEAAERAYERGFAAGFDRARAA